VDDNLGDVLDEGLHKLRKIENLPSDGIFLGNQGQHQGTMVAVYNLKLSIVFLLDGS
jgi:hypothetical protein